MTKIYIYTTKYIYIYISYTLNQWQRDLNTDFTLGNCLFGSAKRTKNADLYKYKCRSLGFDSRSKFSFTDAGVGKYVIIFGADMSSSVHILITKIKIS